MSLARLASSAGIVCIAAAWACGGGPRTAPEPTYGALGGEVARVGEATVGASLVGEVARARGVSPRVALGDLVEDSLAAQGARAERLDGNPAVGWATTATLGRALTRRLQDEAQAQGAPTDDELARLTVVHVVVLRTRSLTQPRALFAARAIADAVSSARTPEEFQARAKAASGELRTSIELLPAFDAAGHTEDDQHFDPDFTAAAFALHVVGEVSPVVETPFGWHVIRLVSRERPPDAELERRRTEMAAAVLALRARGRLAQVLRERRERTRIEVSEGADDLMAQVTLAR